MEDYNVKRTVFADGVVDTRIYKKMIKGGGLTDEQRQEAMINALFKQEPTEEQIEDNKRRSAARAKQNIYDICRNENWDWFVTLTLNPEKVDRYNYNECSKKVSQWLKNCRKKCPDLKYIIVPEMHDDGAFHFHGLLANIENLVITCSGHKAKKTGDIIYNLDSYRFGWSTMTKVKNNDAVIKYMTKYITKELIGMVKGKKKYWVSRNVERPKYEYEELNNFDKCIMWQELMDTAISGSERIGNWNEVMYFQNSLLTSASK